MKDFVAMTGYKRWTAQQRMARLIASGKAVCTTKIVRTSTGAEARVPAYRLVA